MSAADRSEWSTVVLILGIGALIVAPFIVGMACGCSPAPRVVEPAASRLWPYAFEACDAAEPWETCFGRIDGSISGAPMLARVRRGAELLCLPGGAWEDCIARLEVAGGKR